MLLKEHEVYHKMDAAQAQLKEKAVMHIARTTNATGEQFHCEVPIYPDDTRAQIKTRLNFFLSLIQDRMTDENEAVMRNNLEHQRKVATQEALRRNNESFAKQAKALKKRIGKIDHTGKGLSESEYETQLADLKSKLAQANAELEISLSPEEAKASLETAEKEIGMRADEGE